ncbi:UDP-3-O-(3-hydroxymyristoyl)glucosamine N-acyltransferase [Izhakiella australiensis]|uniref:UDP-3-O-(3-hydroxymyristoyl)glucosamine N-acyltransferase n=1 Tax=Izhakiella australiensis TaxID=1926881 RepID=A0A1S8YRA7_9GAMM|nr:acyltransferase [Izhakiella australiensis]OON41604.1 UDP-3-O-(3-hydroxymyristoyl)glucosamine N-acyltransferase [Izhakiella australiensis]
MHKIELRESGVRDVIAGEKVVIYQPVNIYGCTLGDRVFIGPFVEIQRNCQIGSDCKVQSHSFICEYVVLGNGCFIGHGVNFANDLFQQGAPDPDPANWRRITLGDNVTVGSGATILAEFICSGAVIGAGSVVTRSIREKGIYAGNPARQLRRL